MPMETRAATALVRETLALRRALLPLFTRDGIDDAQRDAAASRSPRSSLLALLATVGWRIRHRIDEMIAT